MLTIWKLEDYYADYQQIRVLLKYYRERCSKNRQCVCIGSGFESPKSQ